MERTPKVLVEAFTAQGATACGVKFRDLTPTMLLALEKMDHPLLHVGEATAGKSFSTVDVIRMLFVFANAGSRSLELLGRGQEAFDAAAAVLSDTIPLHEMPAIGDTLRALYVRAVSTIPGASPTPTDGQSLPGPDGAPGEAPPFADGDEKKTPSTLAGS